MNASLRRGLSALPDTTQAVMVLLADLPELTTEDLDKVFAAVDLTGDMRIWRGTTENGAPGHPIVFHHALFNSLKQLQGDDGGSVVVKQHRDNLFSRGVAGYPRATGSGHARRVGKLALKTRQFRIV